MNIPGTCKPLRFEAVSCFWVRLQPGTTAAQSLNFHWLLEGAEGRNVCVPFKTGTAVVQSPICSQPRPTSDQQRRPGRCGLGSCLRSADGGFALMGASQSAGQQQGQAPEATQPGNDVRSDQELRAAEASSLQPVKARMARAGAPAWQGMSGAKRIQAEFKHLRQQIDAGQLPQIFGIYMLSDDLYKWRFKLKNFDNDCQPGRDLNADLAQLFRCASRPSRYAMISLLQYWHLCCLPAGRRDRTTLSWRSNFHIAIPATPSF